MYQAPSVEAEPLDPEESQSEQGLIKDDALRMGERDLMDIVTASLDWDVIEKLLEEKYGFSLDDDIEFKDGKLTVKGDRIAYQMDFQARITLSLMIGRDGRCVDVLAGMASSEEPAEETTPTGMDAGLEPVPGE